MFPVSWLRSKFGGDDKQTKTAVILDGSNIRVKNVVPDDDVRCWEGVTGNGAIFRKGFANPVEYDFSDAEDNLEDTEWISTERYTTVINRNFWRDALTALESEEIEKWVKISAFASIGMNLIIMILLLG